MSDLDLCYVPARTALEQFRRRELSPVEVLEAQLQRAAALEPAVNAFTDQYVEEARKKARAAEARFMKTDGRLRALEGLSLAVKDAGHIKGRVTAAGSLLTRDFVASHTSPVNERLIRAGAIVHARTATPEFSCAAVCHSKLNGVTRNPWNLDLTPGGSSGGAGAALASGTTTLATGSDIAGSIRIPASCCGVVGYKPPYGRNPNDPPFNLDFYCHPGPMARSVGDCILMQNVMCGPHPRDNAALRPKLRLRESYPPIAGWRIAVSADLGAFEIEESVRAGFARAVDAFRDLGAEVEEVDLGWGADLVAAAKAHVTHIFGASLAPYLDDRRDQLTAYARVFAEAGAEARAGDFLAALEMAGAMWERLGPLLERYRLLLCPTTAIPAAPASFDPGLETMSINGVEVDPMLGWVMTTPFNMLSRCPVLAVPAGRAPSGAPVGLQIVGGAYRDADVIRAGLAYEAHVGPWFQTTAERPDPTPRGGRPAQKTSLRRAPSSATT